MQTMTPFHSLMKAPAALDDMREIYRGSMRLFKRDIDFETKKVGHRNMAFG